MVDRLRAPLAGAAAGAAEVMITMPFEVTKNRMQLAGAGSSQSVIKSMAETIASAGPTGLYYGVQAQMLQVCGKSGIRFAVYDQLQRVVPNQPFISGTLAGVAEALIWVAPTERLKMLRQAEISASAGQRKHSNLLASVAHVVRDQGVAGLWVGVGPTVLRQAIANGTRFAIYERVVASLRATYKRRNDGATSVMLAPLAGGVTGVASVLLTNPIDVLKTRVQTSSGAERVTLRALVATEGIRVLARGLLPRAIKIGIGQAVIFGTYDFLMRNASSARG